MDGVARALSISPARILVSSLTPYAAAAAAGGRRLSQQLALAMLSVLEWDLSAPRPEVWVRNSTLTALTRAFFAGGLLISGQPPVTPPFLLCGAGSERDVDWSSGGTRLAPFASAVPPSAALSCRVCPAGRVSDASRAAAGQPCAPCQPGAFSALAGQGACSLCASGAAAPQPASPLCSLCPAGSAAAGPGATGCGNCTDGSFSAQPGSAACLACPPGHVSGAAALTLLSAHMFAVDALSAELLDAAAWRGCAQLPAPPAPPPAPRPPPPVGLTQAQSIVTALTFAVAAAAVALYCIRLQRKHGLLLRLTAGESLAAMFQLDKHGHAGDAEAAEAPGAGLAGSLVAAAACLVRAAECAAREGGGGGAAAELALSDAAAALAAALGSEARHPDGNFLAGALHYAKGEHGRAAARFRFAASACAGAPRRAIAEAAAGIAEAADEDCAAAERHLLAATKAEPRLAVIWLALGNVRLARGESVGALHAFETCLSLDAGYFKALFNAALALAALGRWDDACERLRAAAELRPRCGHTRAALGEALLRRGDARGAVEQLQLAVSLRPRDPEPHVRLGRAQLRTGRARSACSAFLRALELEHASADALCGLALVEWARGRAAQAERLLSEALRHDAQHFQARLNLALLWLSCGRLEDALAGYWRLEARLEAAAQASGAYRAAGGPWRLSARDPGAEGLALGALARHLRALQLLPPREGPPARREEAAEAVAEAVAPHPLVTPQHAASAPPHASLPSSSPPRLTAPACSEPPRLLLLSDAVGACELLAAAARPRVLVLRFDARRASPQALLRAARQALLRRAADLPAVTSVGIVTPPAPAGQGEAVLRLSCQEEGEVRLSSLSEDTQPDACALLDGLRALIGTYEAPAEAAPALHGGARVRSDAPQLHFLGVAGGATALAALQSRFAEAHAQDVGDALRGTTRAEAHGQPPPRLVEVLSSDEMFRAAAHAERMVDDAAEAKAAGGVGTGSDAAHMAALYFSSAGLARWAARPEATRPPMAPEARITPLAALWLTSEGAAKRKASGDHSAYGEYIKRRAAAAETAEEAEEEADGGVAEPPERSERHDSACSQERDQGEAAFAPPSASLTSSASSASPPEAPALPIERRRVLPLKARVVPPAAPWAAVQLLIDLPWSRFGTRVVQAYFLRELAEELDVSPARLRVTSYDRPTGAVTVTILAAAQHHRPGSQAPPEAVAALLEAKAGSGALTIDSSFGGVVFLRAFTQQQAEAERVGDHAAPSVQPQDASGFRAMEAHAPVSPSALPEATPAPRRLLLLSRRAVGWQQLEACAAAGVLVVSFSHEHGTLDGLVRDICAVLGGHRSLPPNSLASVGLLSQHKPGCAGLVRRHRLSVRNVCGKPALRSFLATLAQALAPAGGVHLLGWHPGGSEALLEQLRQLCGCEVLADGADGAALSQLYLQQDALRRWQDAPPQARFTPSVRAQRRAAAVSVSSSRLQPERGREAHAEAAAATLAALHAYRDGEPGLSKLARDASVAPVPRLSLGQLRNHQERQDPAQLAPRVVPRSRPPQFISAAAAEADETQEQSVLRSMAREETGLWAAPVRPGQER